MWKQVVTGVVVLVIGFAILLGATAKFGNVFVREDASQSDDMEVLPLPPPTVSRETTFLTEPIDEYGYIDYLAALNQVAKADVTVDDNAEVLFAQAGIGLSEFSRSQREEFCRLIGLETTSASQTEFIPRTVLMDEDPTLKRALAAPWRATELPEVVAWLESNSAALELVVQGTKRSKCYVPLLPDETSNSGATLVNVLLPVHQRCREVAQALAARAMLRLGESQPSLAREDLIACHRLAWLMAQTPILICGLVGCAIESVASTGDSNVLQSGMLNAPESRAYLTELQQLPPMPNMVDKLNFGDRLMVLDMLISMEAPKATNKQGNENLRVFHDEILRVCNERFDTFVSALRLPKYSDRKAQEKIMGDLLRSTLPPKSDPSDQRSVDSFNARKRKELEGRPPSEAGRAIGEINTSLLFPNFANALNNEVRVRTRRELVQLGFALVIFKLEHGEFPQSSGDLVPQYLASVPIDTYCDEPFRYQKTSFGCRVWSVGQDGVDDMTQSNNPAVTRDDLILQLE